MAVVCYFVLFPQHKFLSQPEEERSMPIELMFIIAAVVVVLVIIMWPTKRRQSPSSQHPERIALGGPMARADSGQRFGYRRSLTPTRTEDDSIVSDAVDTLPAVVDVVDLALRTGHKLIEAVHTHPTGELACVDPNRVDATGEPLPPDSDEMVCGVEPEAPDADTDTTTVDDVPADADQTET